MDPKLKQSGNVPLDLTQINKNIKKLDDQIQFSSNTLKEEKKLIKNKSELEAQKLILPEAQNTMNKLNSLKKDAFDLRTKMKDN